MIINITSAPTLGIFIMEPWCARLSDVVQAFNSVLGLSRFSISTSLSYW